MVLRLLLFTPLVVIALALFFDGKPFLAALIILVVVVVFEIRKLIATAIGMKFDEFMVKHQNANNDTDAHPQ
jgi:hypothetical protein